jgi:hypothetical protein
MKLDGEKTKSYLLVRKLARNLCKEGSFTEQFLHLEQLGEFIWNLTNGGRGVFIDYKPDLYRLNISFKIYDKNNDIWKTETQDKFSLISPSTQTNKLIEKYKKIINKDMTNNKKPLNEAKNKKYSEEEVDQLRRSLSGLILKFKSSFKQHVEDPSMIKKLDAVYKAIEDMPSVSTLKNNLKKEKKNKQVEEEIIVGTDQEAININKSNPNAKIIVNPKAAKSGSGVSGMLSEFIDDTTGYDLVTDVIDIYNFCKKYNSNPEKPAHKTVKFQWADDDCQYHGIIFIDKSQNINKRMCVYKNGSEYKMGNEPVEQGITQIQESKKYRVGDVLGFLNEAKHKSFEIYHKTYSAAIEAALNYATDNGYTYDKDEVFREIGLGPRKPQEGQTNKFSITLYKDGKEQKKALQIQVYGMTQTYELNVYIF